VQNDLDLHSQALTPRYTTRVNRCRRRKLDSYRPCRSERYKGLFRSFKMSISCCA